MRSGTRVADTGPAATGAMALVNCSGPAALRLADDPTTGLVRQQGGGECLVVTLPAAHPHASTRPAALGGSRGSCVSAAGFSDTGT